MAQLQVGEIENAEHISVADGENINAKRLAFYGYNSVTGLWTRAAVNSSGELVFGVADPGGDD